MKKLKLLISILILCITSSFAGTDGRKVVQSLEYRKYVYDGEVLNGLPHGKGCLTDRRGTTYEGDFRNGLRHGLIVVKRSGKEPVKQVWVNDKFDKSIPAGPDMNGVVPKVTLLDGKAFGYGSSYDPQNNIVTEGFFIDGKLEGKAKIVASDREETGWYRDGVLGEVHVRWKGGKWKTDDFIGIQKESFRKGIRRRISKNGSYAYVHIGEFVNDRLHGKGEYICIEKKDTVSLSGMFKDGYLCGDGRIEMRGAPSVDGMRTVALYKGEVLKNRPHGKGCEDITVKNLPDGRLRITRYGVSVREYVKTPDAVIKMEGDFVEGLLVKGKVTVSNGTVMYGRFENGKLAEGRLVKKYSDGSSYEGECLNGKYHGYGRVCYPDGTVYEGMFVNGAPEGRVE